MRPVIFPPMSQDLPWLVFPSRRRRSWIGRCVDESEGGGGERERERREGEGGGVGGGKEGGEKEKGGICVLDCKSQHDRFPSYSIFLL